jgi:hypothetical protein
MENIFFLPSADQLRPKSGKTMAACAVAGHSKLRSTLEHQKQTIREKFLLKRRLRERKQGKKIAAQVLLDLQRKGLCGKEAFLLT